MGWRSIAAIRVVYWRRLRDQSVYGGNRHSSRVGSRRRTECEDILSFRFFVLLVDGVVLGVVGILRVALVGVGVTASCGGTSVGFTA